MILNEFYILYVHIKVSQCSIYIFSCSLIRIIICLHHFENGGLKFRKMKLLKIQHVQNGGFSVVRCRADMIDLIGGA